MNRREFIQRGLALAAALSLGVRLPGSEEEQVVEIVDFKIDNHELNRCFQFGRAIFDGVQGGIEVEFDVKRALDAAYFIDEHGNRYPYRVIERAVEVYEKLPPLRPLWPMVGKYDPDAKIKVIIG